MNAVARVSQKKGRATERRTIISIKRKTQFDGEKQWKEIGELASVKETRCLLSLSAPSTTDLQACVFQMVSTNLFVQKHSSLIL